MTISLSQGTHAGVTVTEPTWQPIDDHERELWRARARGDQEAYLRELAGSAILLPVLPAESGGRGPVSWVSTEISGQRCVVAFTSPDAMRRVLHADPAYRSARFLELSATWPDASAWLAVDPGLPIEVFLTADIVAELAALGAQPANQFETDLLAAADAGDMARYLTMLQAARILLPLTPGTDVREVTDPDFVFWRSDGNTGPVPAFTSPARLRDQFGDRPHTEVSLDEMAGAWPDPGADLVIDPGAAHCVVVPGAVLRR